MSKGIREFAVARFAKYLPQLTELGNAGFRRKVMDGIVAKYAISVASAATHYNHALKLQRATDPESVATLGRAEDKKGGRKPIHTVDVIKVKTGEVVAVGLSKAAAESMIAKASAARKAKLSIKPVEAAAEPAAEPAAEQPAEAVAA